MEPGHMLRTRWRFLRNNFLLKWSCREWTVLDFQTIVTIWQQFFSHNTLKTPSKNPRKFLIWPTIWDICGPQQWRTTSGISRNFSHNSETFFLALFHAGFEDRLLYKVCHPPGNNNFLFPLQQNKWNFRTICLWSKLYYLTHQINSFKTCHWNYCFLWQFLLFLHLLGNWKWEPI